MNHEARVIFLRRMEAEVRAAHLKLLGGGPLAPASTAYTELLAKIDRWEHQLRAFEREIASQEHWVLRRTGGGGRRASYSQRQSLRSHQQNHAGLRARAAGLAKAIAELLAALSPDSVAWRELIKSLEKVMSHGGDDLALEGAQVHQLTQIVQQTTPGPSSPSAPPGAFPATSLLTLCLALYAILKRGGRR